MKTFLYYLQLAVLTFIECGLFVFLGIAAQTILAQYNPSFYWWGIAGYACAGIFGLWFVIYAVKSNKWRRRLKSNKQPPGPSGPPRKLPSSSTTVKHRAPSASKKRGKK